MSTPWYENFLANMAQTPSEYYKSLLQNTVTSTFDDTTQKWLESSLVYGLIRL